MFLFQILTFIHFFYPAVYFLVAGQFIFYQLCFSHVFKQIDARNFLDIRKIADPILQVRLSIIYYSSLALGNTKIRETANPSDEYATQLRYAWLKWIGIRGVIVTAGFIILLIDAVR